MDMEKNPRRVPVPIIRECGERHLHRTKVDTSTTLQRIWRNATYLLSMSQKRLSTCTQLEVASAHHVLVLLLLAALTTYLTSGCQNKNFGLRQRDFGKVQDEPKLWQSWKLPA